MIGTALVGLSGASFYFYNKGKNEAEKVIILEQQQQYINTRKRIDEATSPNRSPDAARDRLRQRQETRSK